jgi:hypothetical protein
MDAQKQQLVMRQKSQQFQMVGDSSLRQLSTRAPFITPAQRPRAGDCDGSAPPRRR